MCGYEYFLLNLNYLLATNNLVKVCVMKADVLKTQLLISRQLSKMTKTSENIYIYFDHEIRTGGVYPGFLNYKEPFGNN